MLVCCARNYVAVKFKTPFDVGSFALIHAVEILYINIPNKKKYVYRITSVYTKRRWLAKIYKNKNVCCVAMAVNIDFHCLLLCAHNAGSAVVLLL